MSNSYEVLSAVNVNEHKAQKGGFDYLSWADAVNVLQKHFPEATWSVREWDGLPYVTTPAGSWVCVTVEIGGLPRTQWHPVLDHRNKTIAADKLDVFAINTSIQRCLAKAIALHGLGLYIFRGEDLPNDEHSEPEAPQEAPQQKSPVDAIKELAGQQFVPLKEFAKYCGEFYGTEDWTTLDKTILRRVYHELKNGNVTNWLNARVPS